MTTGETLRPPSQAEPESDPAQEVLERGHARLRSLVEHSADMFWEQDEAHRFKSITHADGSPVDGSSELIGSAVSEATCALAPGHGTWERLDELRTARLPFSDVLIKCTNPAGQVIALSVSGKPVFDASGSFCGYRGIARDVTREKRFKRLLELNLEVAGLLSDASHKVDALQSAIQAICQSEGWEAGQYWSLDRDNDLMRYFAGWHVSKQAIEDVVVHAKQLMIGRGVGLVGSVWNSGQPLWVPDVAQDSRLLRKDVAERAGWRSALLVPVTSQEETIGVLDFNAPHIPQPDEYVLHVIRMLASQIGHFHQRAADFRRISESEARYSSTVELAAIGISHVGTNGQFLHVNRQLCDMLGYTKEELLAKTVKDVSHPDDAGVTDEHASALRAGRIDSFKVEKRYLHKDGRTVWVRITVAEKRGVNDEPIYDISVVEDISDRKRAEERVEYLATHDEMTGLPNRAMFTQLLDRAVESAKRRGKRFSVLFIDLDRFKAINDSLGHEAGDTLLKTMAARFKDNVRASDVVARLGGDEFVVLLDEITESEHAATVARNLVSAALKPVLIRGQECRVTASVGISVYPDDADDAEFMIKNADMAMYLAKEEGKNNYQFYSREIRALSVERIALESNLANALERREFRVQYQAKVSLATGEINGVEALLRWWNPELGAVSPTQFIPVAEETGLIVPIGKWVLETACAQSVEWERKGLSPVCMAINISPRQFRDPGFLDGLAEVLQSSGVNPGLLELEITESMVMHNVGQAVQKLEAIKEMGVRLAIDDFGTGYSSLAQLKRFPIDTLKVDRSFIRDIPTNAEDRAITEAIISMGRTLGVTVVAEGVETAEQQAFLSSRLCDEMQGYYFSKPSHPNEFASLLRKHVAAPRT